MKPTLFLDVDGVLNTRNGSLDADKLDLLQAIVQATGAQVVISSTWRHHPHMMARLKAELEKRGIVIAGQTPDAAYRDPNERFWVASTRASEIQAWLAANTDVQRFVIVDDAPFTEMRGWLVQTQSDVGLTPDLAQEIINRLKS